MLVHKSTLFCLTLALAACGPSSPSGDTDDDPPRPTDDALREFAEAVCDFLIRCTEGCNQADREWCIADEYSAGKEVEQRAQEKGLTYDGLCLERKTVLAWQQICQNFPVDVDGVQGDLEACRALHCEIWNGSGKEGEACVPEEGGTDPCEVGLECLENGTCGDPCSIILKEGEVCGTQVLFPLNGLCDAGLLCAGEGDVSRCRVRGGLGDSCDVLDADCLTEYRCLAGTCSEPIPLGEPCLESYQCADGLVCDNGTCAMMCSE